MSSFGQGYFYTPDDQTQIDALERQRKLALALQQQGSQDPGNTPYAGLASAGKSLAGALLGRGIDTKERDLTSAAQGKYNQALGQFLGGSGNAAINPETAPSPVPGPSPQIANGPGPQATPPNGAMGAMLQGNQPPASPGPAPVPQSPPPQGGNNDYLSRLMATGNPALIAQFSPQLFGNQLDRDNKTWENQQPLGLADRQKSDLELQRSEVLAKYNNGLPLTASEKATLGIQQGQLAVSRAQLNKPVSVGYGETLVNPTNGKVVYGGSSISSPLGSDGKPLTGDAYLATLSPGIAGTAKAIASYRQAPLTAMALRSPQGSQLMQAVNQLNPNYDATQYAAKNKSRLDFATGKNGNTVRSLNVAVQHLDQLGQLSQALDNGNIQLFNKIGQGFAAQTGNQAPTNFNAAKQLVGDEIVKAIVGAGGGVGDREEAAKNISAASSPQQLAGVIQTYKGLMAGQLSGLKQQYEKNTGLQDFEDYLAPETKVQLQNHQAGSNMGGGGNNPHPQDAAAIAWARANPKDPRSSKILSANGVR